MASLFTKQIRWGERNEFFSVRELEKILIFEKKIENLQLENCYYSISEKVFPKNYRKNIFRKYEESLEIYEVI